jgi:hypothetical protein
MVKVAVADQVGECLRLHAGSQLLVRGGLEGEGHDAEPRQLSDLLSVRIGRHHHLTRIMLPSPAG